MKYLFFLVLFANIVFFLWEITNGYPQSESRIRQAGSSFKQEILLVSETKSESKSSKTGQWTVSRLEMENIEQPEQRFRVEDKLQYGGQRVMNKDKKDVLCNEVGPFLDLGTLKKWSVKAGLENDAIEVFNKNIEIQHGFVIFHPPAETYEASKANFTKLKRQGITDLWLFKKGESRGMISLGIYRNKQSADNIQRQFVKQGLDARIKPYFKTEERFFARITRKEEMGPLLDTWRHELVDLDIKDASVCAGHIANRGT